jgi:hypothetical protein
VTRSQTLLLQAERHSAKVTDWSQRLLLTGLIVLALIGICLLMLRGWRRRARRQADLADLPVAPKTLGQALLEPLPGRYLASTAAGDWLDRIVVHGLGVPSKALLAVTTSGVYIERQGAPDVYIPAASLVGAHLDRGIAGAVYEHGGVAVVTWKLGDRALDSGFRASDADRHDEVVAAVQRLLSMSTTTSRGDA